MPRIKHCLLSVAYNMASACCSVVLLSHITYFIYTSLVFILWTLNLSVTMIIQFASRTHIWFHVTHVWFTRGHFTRIFDFTLHMCDVTRGHFTRIFDFTLHICDVTRGHFTRIFDFTLHLCDITRGHFTNHREKKEVTAAPWRLVPPLRAQGIY